MLRLGRTIRLTAPEKETLGLLTGSSVNPTTIDQHNAIVERAQEGYEMLAAETAPELDADGVDQSGHAECRLLAAVIEGLAIRG